MGWDPSDTSYGKRSLDDKLALFQANGVLRLLRNFAFRTNMASVV